jgi:hypothetical protein
MPTFMLFHSGDKVNEMTGAVPAKLQVSLLSFGPFVRKIDSYTNQELLSVGVAMAEKA